MNRPDRAFSLFSANLLSWRAACAILALSAALGVLSGGAAQAGLRAEARKQAELAKQGEAEVLESDLRAFCPPVEFTDGGYAYTLYARAGASAGAAGRAAEDSYSSPNFGLKGNMGLSGVAYQAAISDITRDCRYDRDKGLIHLQIAAAGRVVVGAGAARGRLTLPMQIKIARGDRVLFAKNYRQEVNLGQTNAATQFLFSEKAAVKIAEATKGTKIFIGFAAAPSRPAAPKQSAPRTEEQGGAASGRNGSMKEQTPKRQKPHADRISPKAGEVTIPESF